MAGRGCDNVSDKKISIRKLVELAIRFCENDSQKMRYIYEFFQELVRRKIERFALDTDFKKDEK